jgi:hypothetical protein
MMIHSIKLPLVAALALSMTAISCLKDKAYENGTIQSGSQGSGEDVKVISLGITVSSTSNFLQTSYPLTGIDTTVDLIPVELGGASDAPADIHVTLTVSDSLLNAYNNANGTNYVDPGAVVEILNKGVVTIPKGARIGYLQVKFNPNDLLTANYALAVVISNVAEAGYTISGNLNTGIVGLGPKNEWDADYNVTGFFFHPSAGRPIRTVKHLYTASLTGVLGAVGDLGLGSPFQFDIINNQLQNWSSGAFTSSGFMTADNPGNVDYSDPSNGGNVPGDANFNSKIYNNTYDPATKTFWMHYGYKNGAVVDQTGYTRQIYEKWVRIN